MLKLKVIACDVMNREISYLASQSKHFVNVTFLNQGLHDTPDKLRELVEKEGKECVFLVQDYIKRIRSTVNHKELRFELSIISDEFKTIAKDREIPILTAMQLNR